MRLERQKQYRVQLQDPGQRAQSKEQYVAGLRQQGDLQGGLGDLHLSEEQLNRIYELTAEWNLQAVASDDAKSRNRWPPEPNPLIAAELGVDVADQWAKYQRESPGRFAVREIAGRMAADDVPLTAPQRREMIEVYTTIEEERGREFLEKGITSPTSEAEAIEFHEKRQESRARYRQILLDRAASILSAKQLDILRRESEQDAASRNRAWEYLRSSGKLAHIDEDGCLIVYMPD